MSRAIEQYVCTSEDRSHYNTDRNIDDSVLYQMYIQALYPPVIQYIRPIKSENEQQIKEIIDQQTDDIVQEIIDGVNEMQALFTDEIDEIIENEDNREG